MPPTKPILEEDSLQDLLGTCLTTERLKDGLVAYADVLAEIRRLRELDLTTMHPAVIFEPTAPYRAKGGG